MPAHNLLRAGARAVHSGRLPLGIEPPGAPQGSGRRLTVTVGVVERVIMKAGIFAAVLAALGLWMLAASPARAQPVAWTRLQLSPRVGHAMAYDAGRAITVLFGGSANGTSSGQTWEWNGTDW